MSSSAGIQTERRLCCIPPLGHIHTIVTPCTVSSLPGPVHIFYEYNLFTMSAHQSPPKRPRLSLQIKAISNGPSVRTSRTIAAAVDPKSPTAFNTLSNVYVTAIDRATPVEPVTAINTRQPLMIQTQGVTREQHMQTPYAVSYPETPLTAQPLSPAVAAEVFFPSSMTMTATPPLSAGPMDPKSPAVFSFSAEDTSLQPPAPMSAVSPRAVRQRLALPLNAIGGKVPYVHPRALHSILRNSPLPPPTAKTPISPRRQSLRLQEKAARRVGYNSPLTQTIITNKYTKSHIDLLVEEVSPYTTPVTDEQAGKVLDLTMAYTGDETRDGGQTPGPFEEMRRRMAGLATSTPVSPSGGIRKRKKKDKDKKRRWVWTIGQEEDDEDIGGALAAIRAAARASASNTPVEGAPATSVAAPLQPTVVVDSPMEILTPSIETAGQDEEVAGEVMSQTGSTVSESVDRALTPGDMDIDMITPTVTRKRLLSADIANRQLYRSERQDSVDLFNPDTGSRRDTPVPADMMVA